MGLFAIFTFFMVASIGGQLTIGINVRRIYITPNH